MRNKKIRRDEKIMAVILILLMGALIAGIIDMSATVIVEGIE
jgi:hypothetical protein